MDKSFGSSLTRLALTGGVTSALALALGSGWGAHPAPAELRAQAQALFGSVAPVSPQEVAAAPAVLGRALFWDARLSLDGKTACASCHPREDHGADRRRLSINAKGRLTTPHSQTVFMAQDQATLRWYGDRRDGAQQAERSLTGSMGFGQADEIRPLLKTLATRPRSAAGPGQRPEGAFMTAANYALALQAYQRTLRTPAPFDAFVQGDDTALSPVQRAGPARFIDTGCASCHGGPLLGGASLQKFGLRRDYWLATGSQPADAGRFNTTKDEGDRYVLRVPMLRNIAKTAPYFHDGSVAALPDAVRIMGEVQLGQRLGNEAVAEIVAFLESLSGEVPEHYAAPALPTAAAPASPTTAVPAFPTTAAPGAR
jgi:cytochrome c peroxidase